MLYFAWLLAVAGLAGPLDLAPAPTLPVPVVTMSRPLSWLRGTVPASSDGVYQTIRARQKTPTTVSPLPSAISSAAASYANRGTKPPASAPTVPVVTSSRAGSAQLASQMVGLINQARTAAGLPPYQVNPTLTALAMRRAEALASTGDFTHDLPQLGYPLAMEQAAGIRAWGMGAENIAEAATVDQAFWLLMASPAHRSNILNPYETQVGVGVARLPNGVAVSELFIGPNG
jgi:uncharacterized protein YkwD